MLIDDPILDYATYTPAITRHLSESWHRFGIAELRLNALKDWIETNAAAAAPLDGAAYTAITQRRAAFLDALDIVGKRELVAYLLDFWTERRDYHRANPIAQPIRRVFS